MIPITIFNHILLDDGSSSYCKKGDKMKKYVYTAKDGKEIHLTSGGDLYVDGDWTHSLSAGEVKYISGNLGEYWEKRLVRRKSRHDIEVYRIIKRAKVINRFKKALAFIVRVRNTCDYYTSVEELEAILHRGFSGITTIRPIFKNYRYWHRFNYEHRPRNDGVVRSKSEWTQCLI